MAKAHTPSFILEKKLLTSPHDEEVLSLRFRYAWKIHNQVVRHARKQLSKLLSDKEYREQLRVRRETKLSDKRAVAEVNQILANIRMSYGLSQYQFKLWVKPLQHRYKKHLDSRTAQAIADGVWTSVEKFLFGNGREIHFARLDDITSIQGNDNKTGIRFRKGRIHWNGLMMQVAGDPGNNYETEALRHPVKYCRIVRRPLGCRYHYYVQLVLEGRPPEKHAVGKGRVRIDPGTLSVAVTSSKRCVLEALDEGIPDRSADISRLSRAMDRSRRTMNPDNYMPDGAVRKGRKVWKYSHHYRVLALRKKTLERKAAASRKQHHEALAGDILSLGDDVYTEDMNYTALQRRSRETTVNSKGRYNRKKRFGKSLQNGAPAMLLQIVDRKLSYHGLVLKKVNTRTFRASQYNHITDEYVRKRLSRRHNVLNGRWVQRDLYSAFLLMNSKGDLQSADRSLCLQEYESFLINHDRCISGLLNSDHKILSSFGLSKA